MTTRHIHASDGTLPPLSLPPGALAPTDHQHCYDVDDEPPAIEPIEHRIRLDFMAGGPIRQSQLLERHNPWASDPADTDPWQESGRSKPAGLSYAEASCRRTLDAEREYYDRVESDDSADLTDVPAFLARRLQVCQTADDPGEALEAERTRRERWYSTIIPWRNLYHILKRSSFGSLISHTVGDTVDAGTLIDQNAFVGMIVVDDSADLRVVAREYSVPGRFVVHEDELSSSAADCAPIPSEFGINLPAPLLVGDYASGSQYPLLPWSDALVCSCPTSTTGRGASCVSTNFSRPSWQGSTIRSFCRSPRGWTFRIEHTGSSAPRSRVGTPHVPSNPGEDQKARRE